MEILKELNKTANVLGAFVVDDRGLVASTLPPSFDKASAMSAGNGILQTMQGVESVTQQRVDELVVEGVNGKVIAHNLDDGCLCVLCTGNVNLALLNMTLGAVSKRVRAMLASGDVTSATAPAAPAAQTTSAPPKSAGADAMAKLRGTLGGR